MRNRERGAVFRQSLRDFPCPVMLGEKLPYFSLHRYKKGLRFLPPADEGYTMRGDKQRLLYKGRRKSHRFTILGDTSFEYDCVLLREPETNIITLYLEGGENYDFLRQPDFVPDDFLKGSYAVYKKETLIGEGTGKLCHIHRPQIIDARGRRCWGALAVVNNELRITIPDNFLNEAVYPVIVDPTVGTSTVGSQYKHTWDADEPPEPLYIDIQIPVNRFLVPETITGQCTAYLYSNADDPYSGGRPVLYSDNGNSPLIRKSMNEGLADFRVISGKPAGWRTATFNSNGSIASGTYIWFGVFTEYCWYPRFDYGSKCYMDWWDDYDSIPNTYPHYDINWYENFKLSMYFTYTSAQNYVRTLTQGVTLSDKRKLTGEYYRGMKQTAGVNSILRRFETFYRKCASSVYNSMGIGRFPLFVRNVTENIKVTTDKKENCDFSRNCKENITVISRIDKLKSIFAEIRDVLNADDAQTFSVLFIRSVPDDVQITHIFGHWWEIIRCLRTSAGSTAETERKAEYYRFPADTVQAAGSLFRGMFLFVRIVSKIFIRDYIIGRFLIAREELVLKSRIVRELVIDSRIY